MWEGARLYKVLKASKRTFKSVLKYQVTTAEVIHFLCGYINGCNAANVLVPKLILKETVALLCAGVSYEMVFFFQVLISVKSVAKRGHLLKSNHITVCCYHGDDIYKVV